MCFIAIKDGCRKGELWESVNFKDRHGMWNKCTEKKVMIDGIKAIASFTIL